MRALSGLSFFFSSRRRHTRCHGDWSSDVCSSDLARTVSALERLVASGRKLILVTGRVLPDLLEIFPRIDLCERVVAENGALLYRPASKELNVLAPSPSARFIDEL